jgi:branched-subunit amino acid transport protein
VAGLTPHMPVFGLRPAHVRFVVDRATLGQVFLRVLQFSPVSVILILLLSEERTKPEKLKTRQ